MHPCYPSSMPAERFSFEFFAGFVIVIIIIFYISDCRNFFLLLSAFDICFFFFRFVYDWYSFFLSFEAAFRLKCNVIVLFHSIPMFPSLEQKCCSIIQYYKNFYQHMLTVLLLKTKTWLFVFFFPSFFSGERKRFLLFSLNSLAAKKQIFMSEYKMIH